MTHPTSAVDVHVLCVLVALVADTGRLFTAGRDFSAADEDRPDRLDMGWAENRANGA